MVAFKQVGGYRVLEGPADGGLSLGNAGRRVRRDGLPENTPYTDTGCDVHPHCLTCPLVRCRYDEPGGARRVFNEDRDRLILRFHAEGLAVHVIARHFGVSRRTVFRALARSRAA